MVVLRPEVRVLRRRVAGPGPDWAGRAVLAADTQTAQGRHSRPAT